MEHRSSARIRSFFRGRIIFNNRMSSMECLVRDISDGGARLELAETITLPDRFDLEIPKKDATYRALIQWRREGEIGVAFETDAPAVGHAEPDTTQRIQRLEEDSAHLRHMLAQMRRELDEAIAELRRLRK